MSENQHWPIEQYQLAPREYLAAFGQLTLVYNMLENMIANIFEKIAPFETTFSRLFFHRLNNRDRIDLLTAVIRKNEKETDTLEALLHCISSYDICTANRNILMHSTYFDTGEDVARFVKRSKNLSEIHFKVSLEELRSVADDTARTFVYAVHIFGAISRRQWAEELPESPLLVQMPLLELPTKIPLPRKLEAE